MEEGDINFIQGKIVQNICKRDPIFGELIYLNTGMFQIMLRYIYHDAFKIKFLS